MTRALTRRQAAAAPVAVRVLGALRAIVRRGLFVVLVAGLALGGLVLGSGGPAAAQSVVSLPITTATATIPVRDGNTLDASIARPVAGRWPVVIMPGTFAGDAITLVDIAKTLAARGFVTVTYNERGFGKSTGSLDAGGPNDVHDVSDALTWAQQNLPVTSGGAGVAGVSYGAGIAPMAAAADPRFRAVAMISGWGDMWESRFPNGTPATASNLALDVIAATEGRPSQEVSDFFNDAVAGKMTPQMRALAAVRSPDTYLPELDANRPALYMSTTMNEMIWPVDQSVDFFNAYTGTKHLDLLPGDHATTNGSQFLGLPDVTWSTAFDWLDTYLTGDSAAKDLPAVRVAPRGPDGTDMLESGLWSNYPFESYPSVAAATGPRVVREYLNNGPGPSTLTAAPGTGTRSLREGQNLLLTNGIPMYQGIFEDVTGVPTTVVPDVVDPGVTGLWYAPALASPLDVRGAARVHLEITPSAGTGSVFVYLLERAPDNGTTYVITHKPYTFTGATPGSPMTLDVDLPYNSYDVPAGHRIVLGVSTGDVMYTSANPSGSTIRIGPGSYLDLPTSPS